ncbi:DNA-binding protein MNB1B-like protein [Carex littledalei]|uniref:DNA-binding protein MNB1B-like protein n=1 Tax=Carex littledalei TaxID=544730 RepID=A0A833W2U5_9POAL|nr:DNA-binding protein MNB1B-like protein [Carex littledalei]
MKGTRAEKGKKVDAKLSLKKKAFAKPKPIKKGKAAKDPNKPKRPPSAFFVFMEEFRKTFKEKNPNNRSVSVVGKAGGEKWKTLSEAEKAPYVAKANKLKSEYNNKMNAYNKKQAEPKEKPADDDEEESDKSKSEVHDDDDEDDDEDDEEEEDDD